MTDEAPRLGRKRDPSRDAAILDAALEVLADVGYVGMTMDMVAVRAKAGKATMYRRWPSKTELVLEALARLKSTAVDLDELPDTGTLRGDMLAMVKPSSLEDSKRILQVFAGIASITHDERFTDAVTDMMVTPWAQAHRALMERAKARREIAADADLETLSKVVASIAGFRTMVERKPFTKDFLVSLIDGVVLPALGAKRVAHESTAAKRARRR